MNTIAPRFLDLSGLYRRCVFRSDARVDSHFQVASELSDHDLRWSGPKVDTVLYKGRASGLQVMALRYGAEVEVTPTVFKDFSLVHMSLNGAVEIDSDGRKVCVGTGRSALVAPKKNIRMRWQQGTEQLIIKIPNALLEEAGLAPASGRRHTFVLPESSAVQWDLLVQSLLSMVDRVPCSPAETVWAQHFEKNVALFLASCAQNSLNGSPRLDQDEVPEESLAIADPASRLQALDAYIGKKLSAPVSTFDLAQATGVSVRTLNLLCRRHRGCTPMELLRNRRLDAVRAQLLGKPGANVTSAALEYGFGHLGRFAAYYRDRFGELPNQTAASRETSLALA